MLSFNKIVHKLSQKKGDIVTVNDIVELIDPTLARPEGKTEVYKTLSRLVHQGILCRIRNGVFLIGYDPLLEKLPQFIDVHYWKLVQVFIKAEVWGANALIAWPKSLELLLQDFSPPKVLHVYVAGLDDVPKKRVRVGDSYEIEFRTIRSKTAKKNFFPTLKKTAGLILTPGQNPVRMRVLSPEAAILDSLLTHSDKEIDVYMIHRFLDRYGSVLDRWVLGKLVQQRYITAINRLREFAKERGDVSLYEKCLSIIRDEGAGCFVTGTL